MRSNPVQGSSACSTGGSGGSERGAGDDESWWRHAVEAGGLGVWDWHVPSGRVRFSREWKAMLGYADHEIGDSLEEWCSRIHPEDRGRCETDLQAHLDGITESYVNEHRMRRKDGDWMWILDRGRVIERDTDGRPLRMIGTHVAIDERKRVEAERDSGERRFRAIFETMFQFTGLMEPDGTLIEANRAALAFAGIERDEAVGLKVWDCPWFRYDTSIQNDLRTAVTRAAAGGFVRYQIPIRGADDRELIIDFSLMPAYDEAGDLLYLVPEGRDISETIAAQEALRESERRFALTFSQAPIGLALVATDGTWLSVNREICEIVGYGEDELLAGRFQDITHPDDLETDLDHVRDLLAGRRDVYRMEKRYLHKQGHVVPVQLDVALLRDSAGKPVHFIAQIQDISQRRAHEAALFEAKELAQVTLNSIGEGVIRVDGDGLVTLVNPSACELIGSREEDLLGRPFDEAVGLYDPDRDERLEDPVGHVLRSGTRSSVPVFTRLRRRDGRLLPISDSVSPVRGSDGSVMGAVFVFQDVSEIQAMAAELEYLARHDTLTSLPNRRAFDETLEAYWRDARAGRRGAYLLYLDLDQFKAINDTCGHAAGDTLLCELAALLKSELRGDDFLARIGGDEFAAIVETGDPEIADLVARKLIRVITDHEFSHQGRIFGVGLSVGITPVDAHAERHSDLLAQADTALYAAKESGRGCHRSFRSGDESIQQVRTSLDVGQRVKFALDHDAFSLFLQRIVDAAADTRGYEVLLRLDDDDGGYVTPDVFLPAARKLGLLGRIDYWTVASALALIQRLRRDGLWPTDAFLSINLSAWNLRDAEFMDRLLQLVDDHEVPGGLVRFEITETEELGDVAHPELIGELRARGYKVWVDDFGTGYNSWDLLKRFEVDGVKVDGSFIRDLDRDPVGGVMVSAIIELGREKNWEIVAEGIENTATVADLARQGVPLFQGFAFHRPELADRALADRA
ncbi:PAS domain S-box protein [Salinisphaera sp. PC39]|uniref:bifunctional diguanylate cyclase/phosphodiesterase n=1 Tax=Salinisphaera sp. PC39 TaxID=1304156 RepID=UPI0033405450